MQRWKQVYFTLEEYLGLVFVALLGLGGVVYAIDTLGLVTTLVLFVIPAAVIAFAIRVLGA